MRLSYTSLNRSPTSLSYLLSSGFKPASLFVQSEPGVWFDPSDVADLAWRRNLLTRTEEFGDAVWTKGGVTVSVNTDVAPDGTTTADRLIEDTSTGEHRTFQNAIFTSGLTYTFSIYVKPLGRSLVQLTSSSAVIWTATFDVTAGSVTNTVSGTASISAAGNGWFRLAISDTSILTASSNMQVRLVDTGINTAYTGNGTSGILIWGAQLELGSTATAYQRISDVNTEVIERFPTATMFTDTAGTTPVTTPGQTVALLLDKSKGLALGSELVTNGDFSSATGWTQNLGWVIGGGVATATATNGYLFQSVASVVAGKYYEYTVTITSYTSGALRFFAGSGAENLSTPMTASGTYTLRVCSRSANQLGVVGANFTGVIDNISAKEIQGNHATQATTASRPTYGIVPLGGRRNLLTFTEQFDNAAWTKDGSTVAISSGPQEWYLASNGVATQSILSQAVSPSADAIFAIDLKADTIRYVRLRYTNVTNSTSVDLDLQTGSSTGLALTDVGGGFYRAYLPFTSGADNTGLINIYLSDTSGGQVIVASASKRIIVRRPQFELGSTATAYQCVTTQYDVTETGVQSLSYLSFDGVDDGMVTNTITPGIDKAQVFAGVRKLSDGSYPTIVEFSANSDGNNGSFLLSSSRSSLLQDYFLQSRGSVIVSTNSSAFAAPSTNVLSGLSDISGDRVTLRVNGTQVGQSTSDQGTGNYLAYQLYIGRRSGATAPFNGQIYSMIVRFGANLDADQIASIERSVGSKTGFFAPAITGVPTIGVS